MRQAGILGNALHEGMETGNLADVVPEGQVAFRPGRRSRIRETDAEERQIVAGLVVQDMGLYGGHHRLYPGVGVLSAAAKEGVQHPLRAEESVILILRFREAVRVEEEPFPQGEVGLLLLVRHVGDHAQRPPGG